MKNKMACINCDNEHSEKFCPNCGEKAGVPKITFSSLFTNFFSTLTNMDKGFLFNLKNLFLNPHQIINDYIGGKRKNIFNPISYLFIAVTIYLLVDSFLHVSTDSTRMDNKMYSIGYEAGKFIQNYFKYFWILSVFWLSIPTKLFFPKFNFVEHLAINSFVIGQATLVGTVLFAVFKISLTLNPVIYCFIIWMLYQVYKNKGVKSNIIFQAIAAVFLFFIELFLFALLIGWIRS